MRILFATAQPYGPEIFGGMQKSTDMLITKLLEKGHHCDLLTGLMGQGLFGFVARMKKKIFGRNIVEDSYHGYTTGRTWFPWEHLVEYVSIKKPDVIVIPCGFPVRMALEAVKTGVPVVMWLQNVEFGDHGGEFADLGMIPCVANSQFTATKYHQAYGVSPHIVYPMIDAKNYYTETSRDTITLVNPHPVKGLDIALVLAEKCPDLSFAFIETWSSSKEAKDDLLKKIEKLPNIKLVAPVEDMREVYKTTKILLAPSKWEEAYGRIATEAHFSGIPVVASNIGGLPEAVGDGGVLIDPKGDIQDWVNAVRQLSSDDAYYQKKMQASFAKSKLPEHDVEKQVIMWEQILKDVIQ